MIHRVAMHGDAPRAHVAEARPRQHAIRFHHGHWHCAHDSDTLRALRTPNMQHAARSTQHAARSTQHATRNTQHATRNNKLRTWHTSRKAAVVPTCGRADTQHTSRPLLLCLGWHPQLCCTLSVRCLGRMGQDCRQCCRVRILSGDRLHGVSRASEVQRGSHRV